MKINGYQGYLGLSLVLLAGSFRAILDKELPILAAVLIWAILILGSVVAMVQSGKLYRILAKQPFEIKKGTHKITNRFPMWIYEGTCLFRFVFKPEHRYRNKADTDQTNKLIGLSSLFIHRNSVRVGWRHNRNNYKRFDLYGYVYNKGIREITYLTSVREWEELVIIIDTSKGNEASIMINGTIYELNIEGEMNWLTFPYFGGIIKAIRDMKFEILF